MALFDGAALIFGRRIWTACHAPGEQNAAICGDIGSPREDDDSGGRSFSSGGRSLGRAATSEVRQPVSECRGTAPHQPVSE